MKCPIRDGGQCQVEISSRGGIHECWGATVKKNVSYVG